MKETVLTIGGERPSADQWLQDAKTEENAGKVGMYLIHNGVVRETSKKEIYNPGSDPEKVTGMEFSADEAAVRSAIEEALRLKGIYAVKVWLAEGILKKGDNIMQVLIGADNRPDCVAGLDYLVGKIKRECVIEKEITERNH